MKEVSPTLARDTLARASPLERQLTLSASDMLARWRFGPSVSGPPLAVRQTPCAPPRIDSNAAAQARGTRTGTGDGLQMAHIRVSPAQPAARPSRYHASRWKWAVVTCTLCAGRCVPSLTRNHGAAGSALLADAAAPRTRRSRRRLGTLRDNPEPINSSTIQGRSART